MKAGKYIYLIMCNIKKFMLPQTMDESVEG